MRLINKYTLPLLIFITYTVSSQVNETIDHKSNEETKTVYFTDMRNGSAVDENGNVLYRTTDGGVTWLNLIVPLESQIKQIAIPRKKDKENRKNRTGKKPVSGGEKDDINNGFMPSDDHTVNQDNLARIKFSLRKPGFVSIKIYNSEGKTVDELARSTFGTGNHEVKWNPSKFPKDAYYYSIVSGEFSQTDKIIEDK